MSVDLAASSAEEARGRLASGDAEAALELAETAAALAPGDAALDELRGDCLAALGRLGAAADAFARAAARAPGRVRAWSQLGVVAERQGDLAQAERAFTAALARAPRDVEALRGLAWVLVRSRRLDDAAAMFGRLLDAAPGDPGAIHMRAALAGEAPPAPPPGHVRAIFDAYAPDFDASLVGDLAYQVPGLLRAALLGRGRFARALDLGCGTGLGGAAIRDLCDRLDGVDVSPGMIARARARGCYDALAVAELVAHLEVASPYQLLIAADVLLYLGDLAPLFAAARRALTPGGWFAFSVERGEGADYRLAATGRYAHARGYVERLAADHGLTVSTLDEAVLRRERGAPVQGLIAVLQSA